MELQDQLSALVSECQDHHAASESKEEELQSMHERMQEMSDTITAQSQRESAQTLSLQGRSTTPQRSRIETYGRSLAMDIRTEDLGGDDGEGHPLSPTELAMLRQMDELRAQLVNAELSLQTREVYRLRNGRRSAAADDTLQDLSDGGISVKGASASRSTNTSSSGELAKGAQERLASRLTGTRGGWQLLGRSPRSSATAASSPRSTLQGQLRGQGPPGNGGIAGGPGSQRRSGPSPRSPGRTGPPGTSERRGSKEAPANSRLSGKSLFGQAWPEAFRAS